jgi:hypothetical protein
MILNSEDRSRRIAAGGRNQTQDILQEAAEDTEELICPRIARMGDQP